MSAVTMSPSELQTLFYQEIPISQSMGIRVVTASANAIHLHVELAANRNHKQTAFGGSQYAACALACYGLFLVGVQSQGYFSNNIVIAEGDIKYKHPVASDFEIVASWQEPSFSEFFIRLKKLKKAKVHLQATVLATPTSLADQIECSYFSGAFVAFL